MSNILPIKINKGTGEPLVLLHGLGNNHKSWTYVLEEIDYKKNNVIAFDLLGFGDASKPSDIEYTPDDHADAVIKSMDENGIKNAIIAGHSMGCIVAVAVAKKRPDLAARLVLLGAPIFKHKPRKIDSFKFWRREDAYTSIFKVIAKSPDLTLSAANALDVVAPLLKGMEITEETWPSFQKSLRNTIMQTQTYQDLLLLKTPTLAIYGHLDFFVIKHNLQKVAKKNKEFITFETMMGPHEITPIHGKSIVKLLQQD
jgi:pimeloyl-ACP methyl ester carboxylesterase